MMADLGIAEIRAEGRRLAEAIGPEAYDCFIDYLYDNADVLLADPAPVGLTESEERSLRWCETHRHPAWQYEDGSIMCMYDLIAETRNDHVLGARLSLGVAGDFCPGCEACQPIDRLSAAPVGLTEAEQMVLASYRRPGNNTTRPLLAIIDRLVPVSPSVDPEEEP